MSDSEYTRSNILTSGTDNSDTEVSVNIVKSAKPNIGRSQSETDIFDTSDNASLLRKSEGDFTTYN